MMEWWNQSSSFGLSTYSKLALFRLGGNPKLDDKIYKEGKDAQT
jgi:hypothetical protein